MLTLLNNYIIKNKTVEKWVLEPSLTTTIPIKEDIAMTDLSVVKSKRKSKIKIPMLGKKFGRLTVVEEAGRAKDGTILWKCKCSCGVIKTINGSSLRKGFTRSCGCYNSEIKSKRFKKIFTTHGMSKTATYRSWCHMLGRCNNPNDARYSDWGGRGIKVCERWLKFENFFADMGEKPKTLTLERINNNKGYYKKNCKWATYSDQNRNMRVYKTNKFGVSGVSWNKQCQKYRVNIGVNSKPLYLGLYETLEQAIKTRKEAEQKYWGKGDD